MDDESMTATEMELLLEEVRGLRADLKIIHDEQSGKLVTEIGEIKSLLNKMNDSTHEYYEDSKNNSETVLDFALVSGILSLLAVTAALASFWSDDSPAMHSVMSVTLVALLIFAVYSLDQLTATKKGLKYIPQRIWNRITKKNKFGEWS